MREQAGRTAVADPARQAELLLGLLLDELGASLKGLGAAPTKEQVQKKVELLQAEPAVKLRERHGHDLFAREDTEEGLKAKLKAEPTFGNMGLAVKLGLLLVKRQKGRADRRPSPGWTAPVLWERVWRRTDDVFCATEDLLETSSAPSSCSWRSSAAASS